MKEFQLLRQGLYHNCPELHGKRLETLMVATEALYHSDTLTALGRHIDNGGRTKRFSGAKFTRCPKRIYSRASVDQVAAGLSVGELSE